ncbi:hypothetical protein B0H13DRAFT_2676330 [Mycena leptocephala]|nr:hypothetical protein B0H13DRAFT_2676330 [Mycena leptocephala]
MPVSVAASDIAVTASPPLLFVLKARPNLKVSSTVIQYETDWNIEIEKDDAADEAEYYLRVDAEAADTEEQSRSPLASLYGTDHPGFVVDLTTGKCYNTKKESMHVEKDGPPYLPMGALTTVKDPLSSICTRPTHPQLPPYTNAATIPTAYAERHAHYACCTKQLYHLPSSCRPRTPNPPQPPLANDNADVSVAPALDLGSFALLAEEMRRRGEVPMTAADDTDGGDGGGGTGLPVFDPEEYWISAHMLDAEGYTRDAVYEAVNGLAYVRSLGELVGTVLLDVGKRVEDEAPEEGVDMDSAAPPWLEPLRTVLEFITPTQYSAKSEDKKPVN